MFGDSGGTAGLAARRTGGWRAGLARCAGTMGLVKCTLGWGRHRNVLAADFTPGQVAVQRPPCGRRAWQDAQDHLQPGFNAAPGLTWNDGTSLWSNRDGLQQSPKSRPKAIAGTPAQTAVAIFRQRNAVAILRPQNALPERDVWCPLIL